VPEAPTTPTEPGAAEVPEGQRDAVEGGGAAVGPHHEQSEFAGPGLEIDLVVEGDVVAEQHDVEAGVQQVAGLGGRVDAGNRDQRQVGRRQLGPRAGQAVHPRHRGAGGRGGLGGQQFVDPVDGVLADLLVGGVDPDDEIGRTGGGELGGVEAGVGHDRLVGGGAHHRRGLGDPGQVGERAAEHHEGHRVLIVVLLHDGGEQCDLLGIGSADAGGRR
jgi:hypothetical protein